MNNLVGKNKIIYLIGGTYNGTRLQAAPVDSYLELPKKNETGKDKYELYNLSLPTRDLNLHVASITLGIIEGGDFANSIIKVLEEYCKS